MNHQLYRNTLSERLKEYEIVSIYSTTTKQKKMSKLAVFTAKSVKIALSTFENFSSRIEK